MIQAVIVDDEPKAIELLEDYIGRIPHIRCMNTFRNPWAAIEFIKSTPPDVLFLDINMPEISGMSLVGLIPQSVQVIFTTAYSEYAVKSYEVEAVDYLLKPIGFERFAKAVGKINMRPAATTPTIISLKSGYQIHRVVLGDILYLEKDGNYMIYHTPTQKILVREGIADALEKLPATFVRVHKSFIVAVDKINIIEKDGLKIGSQIIPVGATYKEGLMGYLK